MAGRGVASNPVQKNRICWVDGEAGLGYYASGLPASGCVASPQAPAAALPGGLSSLSARRRLRFESCPGSR